MLNRIAIGPEIVCQAVGKDTWCGSRTTGIDRIPEVYTWCGARRSSKLASISSPALDRIVRLLTDLGSTEFFITAVPIVYWCLNKTLGLSLGIVTAISGGSTSR